MFAIIIKNLKMQFNNINLILGKSVMSFELFIQKKETSNHTADVLYKKF